MNIILTIGGMFVLIAYQSIFLAKDIIILWWGDLVTTFWMQFCFMNIALAVFNMIPMPPLDGYRLIKIFFPDIVW
jgi:Zn-dependent protease